MGLYLFDVYRSPNIGNFVKANDKFVLVPTGLAPTKTEKLASNLGLTNICYTSIASSRLLGPLVAMNNNGALVSRIAEDYEIGELKSQTGITVERFNSKFTAVGNLVAANDKAAIASPILDNLALSQVKDVLGVEVVRMAFHEYYQVGALMVATNSGAAVYPRLTEAEVEQVSQVLKIEAQPTPVNGGVIFVASGLVANSKNAVAGNFTTGPELVFLTRALGV
jgi:translation initiation factor 6